MLQYYMAIISHKQQLLDMEDLFGTSENCSVGIFMVKTSHVEVGYRFLNVA